MNEIEFPLICTIDKFNLDDTWQIQVLLNFNNKSFNR